MMQRSNASLQERLGAGTSTFRLFKARTRTVRGACLRVGVQEAPCPLLSEVL